MTRLTQNPYAAITVAQHFTTVHYFILTPMWLMSDSSRTSCAHCNEDGWLALHSCIQSYPQWRRRKSLQEGAEVLIVICIWQDSRVSLGCKFVPVQYREYENFLFWGTQRSYIRYVSRRLLGSPRFLAVSLAGSARQVFLLIRQEQK